MNQQQIKKFLDTEAGQAMRDFLIDELKELRQIDKIKEYSTPTAQTIEIKAHKKAYNKLKDILDKLMNINDIDLEAREKDQFYSI